MSFDNVAKGNEYSFVQLLELSKEGVVYFASNTDQKAVVSIQNEAWFFEKQAESEQYIAMRHFREESAISPVDVSQEFTATIPYAHLKKMWKEARDKSLPAIQITFKRN